MTERIYYTDAYAAAFDATVVETADRGRRVYLDRTAFYPTSGGQPHDVGRLGGTDVVDVVDEGARIAHLLSAPLEAAGRVNGRVDWARRFDHMQQHTGQHLLSAVLADRVGCATVSVHFGSESSTLDLEPVIEPAELIAAELRANELVWEQRPVAVTFEDATTAAALRKPAERSGIIRVVAIQGLDRSACGGTHVRNTAEIGPVLLRGMERIRQALRLEFVCGARAVRAARADRELLARLAAQCSAAAVDLPAILESQRAELKTVAAARRQAEEQLARYRARELYDAAAPDAGGVRRALVRDAPALETVRGLAQAYVALPRAVLVATVSAPAAVLIAASPDSGVDAGAALKAALAAAGGGGRGGGSARLAQGTVAEAGGLERVVTALTAS